MSTLLITYDLNRETVRPNITKKIKDSYPNWAKLSESSYAVVTNAGPQDVYNTLSPLLDGNDNLVVITLAAPWWGKASQEVLDWLKRTL